MSAPTLVSTWTAARNRLKAAGIDSPVLDARMLVEAGASVARIDIVTDPHRVLTEEQIAGVEALVLRREAREPVSHIVGYKNFWTLQLAVTPSVLTPRPETELLVATVIENTFADAPLDVLDLGTGSGAILLSILTDRPEYAGVALDASLGALAVAQINADALGLANRITFKHGEWEDAEGVFDVVVSNPPYIRSGEIDLLEPEVARYEPRLALDGGTDGLDAYRRIFAILPRLLKPGGLFVIEAGFGQAEAMWALGSDVGLKLEDVRKDLNGVARVVWGRKAG